MFDLITGKTTHLPHTPAVPLLVSTAAQVCVVGAVIGLPLLYATDQLPEPSTMMAFVAAAPPPAPPPPPPPAPARRAPLTTRPVPTTAAAAPVEAREQTEPEAVLDSGEEGEEGVPGGVEGGIPGGVASGILADFEVPPPPPPPPMPQAPIRIGGTIEAPALIHRVDPVYPGVAISAAIEGIVILEATVDEQGRVEELRVLRSNGVLDRAALEAVRQWRYSPVLLNGRPARFILTVVVSFRLTNAK